MIWPPGQEVGFNVEVSWLMMEGEVVISKCREPPSLSLIDFVRLAEVLKVLMIGPDLERLLRIHQVFLKFV